MQNVNVSVIITTKNEENNIAQSLQSIKDQSYPQDKIEIIVVDNNSTDRTVEVVKKYTENLFTCGPERSAQRNYGVEKSSGKYFLYLDADMILSKTVIQECFDKCEQENLVALYIPEIIIGNGFWIKVRNFERSFYNTTWIDAVRFVRRDKFLEVGGFDLELTGPEDWDFDRRIKQIGKTGLIESPIYHNEGEFSIKRYIKKKAYYSKSFDNYIKKWGRNNHIIRKQLGVCYRFWGVFVENNKWKKLIRHPLLTAGMYFLRILVGIIYLVKNPKTTKSKY